MENQRIRRTQLVTDRSLQFQYVAMVLGFMVMMVLLAALVIYVTGWSQLVERLASVYPQGRLQGILKIIYLRLVLGFLLLTPMAGLVAVMISHRVAGPLVRIRRYLRLMARGEFDLAPLELRRYDELKDIAALINDIIGRERIRNGQNSR